MKSPAEIVNELLETGLDQRQTALLLALVLSTGLSSGSQVESPDDALSRRRKYDREYKQKRRIAARLVSSGQSGGMSTGQVDTSCILKGTSDSQSGIQEVRKKNTDGVIGRAEKKVSRGTRLEPSAELSDIDRQFARDQGLKDGQIGALWVEFVDYWISVPGQRGVKLNWSATWRNRVRAVAGGMNGKRTNASISKSGASDFFAGLKKVAENIVGDGPMAGASSTEIPVGRVNIDG